MWCKVSILHHSIFHEKNCPLPHHRQLQLRILHSWCPNEAHAKNHSVWSILGTTKLKINIKKAKQSNLLWRCKRRCGESAVMKKSFIIHSLKEVIKLCKLSVTTSAMEPISNHFGTKYGTLLSEWFKNIYMRKYVTYGQCT